MFWMKKDDTLTKMLGRIIAEIVAQRHDISALKIQLEEMSKSREQMYNRLLDAFIAVVSPPEQKRLLSGLRENIGLFDEVPVGHNEGYKEDELELENSDETLRSR